MKRLRNTEETPPHCAAPCPLYVEAKSLYVSPCPIFTCIVVEPELGKSGLAARHFGSVDGLLTTSHTVLTPVDEVTYRRDVAMVKIEMGEKAYDSAWSGGKGLTYDEAVSEVWSEPGD
jgi:hypothetical protein